MTQTSPARLKTPHPDPLRRQAIIRRLAQRADKRALNRLYRIYRTDPIPALRQQAKYAIEQITRTDQHTPEPENAVNDAPDLYHLAAEKALLQAHSLAKQSAWQDALRYLGQAIRADERVLDDAQAIQLAKQLTGLDAQKVLNALKTPDTTTDLIQLLSRPQQRTYPLNVRGLMLLLIILATLITTIVLAGDQDWMHEQITAYVRPIPSTQTYITDGVTYHVVEPEGAVPPQGWQTLIALPERGGNPATMLSLFGMPAQSDGILLVVMEPGWYSLNDDSSLTTLNSVVTDVMTRYPVHQTGVALFGFSHSGEVVTRYAQSYPHLARMTLTSGATFIHAPPPNHPVLHMYGSQDDLLQTERGNGNPAVINIADWTVPFNYLVLEGMGHNLHPQQAEIVLSVVKNVYRQ